MLILMSVPSMDAVTWRMQDEIDVHIGGETVRAKARLTRIEGHQIEVELEIPNDSVFVGALRGEGDGLPFSFDG